MPRSISSLSYAYLARFPLTFAATLFFFPVLALKTPASSLLAGLFDLAGESSIDTGRRMFFVVFLALTLAWTIMETFWLVLLYAQQRIGVPALPAKGTKRVHSVVFAFLASPTLIGAFWESVAAGRAGAWPLVSGAALGLLAASTLLLAIDSATPSRAKLRPAGFRNNLLQRFALQQNLSAGYMNPVGGGLSLLPGHARAALLLLVCLVMYVGVGWAKYARIGFHATVPTLAYVLLLFMLLCWALSGLAFFLDRYRVPVFLPLAILFALTSAFPQSDHYYFLRMGQKRDKLVPATVIRAGKRTSIIAVAASGGGIQAAAWTARVLTGLEQQSRAESSEGVSDFGESLRFISAVSGGSVATMYFVNEYTPSGLPRDLRRVLERAETSSLDDVAWGLLYPDLGRAIIPFFPFKYSDRGEALERAFTRAPELSNVLSDWRAGVPEGWRPAVAFNSTITDTGGRLLFSTSDLEPSTPSRRDFYEPALYKDYDIAIVTAVRLSSTFPYVSPAARANPSKPQFHIVDGGYYDNYGISTLVEWLDSALSSPDNPVNRVLIIQIRDSPPDSRTKATSGRGWFYQSFAPISTMLNVRSTGQLSHNKEDIDLLRRIPFKPAVHIESALFQFCGEHPPLSWHLTQSQKSNIDTAWNDELAHGSGWQVVRNFLSGGKPSAAQNIPVCDASPDANAGAQPTAE